MRISSVQIENFRSIESLSVNFDEITAIVGTNNAGKSSILKAIDLFFDASAKISNQDHFMHDQSRKISITIEFCDLTPVERSEFGRATVADKLRVVREFGGQSSDNGEFSVHAKINPAFGEFRTENNGNKKRSLYTSLRAEYDLPAASGDEMEENLKDWEARNPDLLKESKVRGFFGAKNVALGKLNKKTSVRFIQAVKDTNEEASDQRKSPVIGLLSEIVKQTFENRKEFSDFILDSNNKLAEITDPEKVPQLKDISKRLTDTLGMYYSDTSLVADLNKANEISVSFPAPVVNVVHRGLQGSVANVGHGLQRAILFSLVQFLAEQQSLPSADDVQEEFGEAFSDIIILVEEPEIYQHPLKQSLFYEAFQNITRGYNKENGIRVQIIYATHSEKLVSILDIDKIRMLSKRVHDGGVDTVCNSLTIKDFSEGMARHLGEDVQPLSVEAFKLGLHIFNRDVSEGFFAEKVVLVEGVSDKAIIQAAYMHQGRDPLREGIALIDVGGKTKIDKPLFAFRSLGIPTYPIFDNDVSQTKEKDIEQARKRNRLIQSIVGHSNVQDFPVGCESGFAAFSGNLEQLMSEAMGERYHAIRGNISKEFNVSGKDASKSPAIFSAIFNVAKSEGIIFPIVDEIVKFVSELSCGDAR